MDGGGLGTRKLEFSPLVFARDLGLVVSGEAAGARHKDPVVPDQTIRLVIHPFMLMRASKIYVNTSQVFQDIEIQIN